MFEFHVSCFVFGLRFRASCLGSNLSKEKARFSFVFQFHAEDSEFRVYGSGFQEYLYVSGFHVIRRRAGLGVGGSGCGISRFGFVFRVPGIAFRVPGSGDIVFRVLGFVFRVPGFGFRVPGMCSGKVLTPYLTADGVKIPSFRFRVSGTFLGQGLGSHIIRRRGFRVSCFVFRVSGFRNIFGGTFSKFRVLASGFEECFRGKVLTSSAAALGASTATLSYSSACDKKTCFSESGTKITAHMLYYSLV